MSITVSRSNEGDPRTSQPGRQRSAWASIAELVNPIASNPAANFGFCATQLHVHFALPLFATNLHTRCGIRRKPERSPLTTKSRHGEPQPFVHSRIAELPAA